MRHIFICGLCPAVQYFANAPTNGSVVAGVTRVAMHLPNPTAYWSPLLDRVCRLQLVPSLST